MNESYWMFRHNVWHAPPDAQAEALKRLRLAPHTPEDASELATTASDWRARARPYQAPVTGETLRQKVSHANAAQCTRVGGNHRFKGLQ